MLIREVKKLPTKERFLYWVRERESIRLKRLKGQPKPWTDDEILQQYRFCNVHREHDTVTKWISKSWRTTNGGHQDLWFAMVVARLLNLPESLKELGFPLPWNPQKFLSVIESRTARGLPSFNGAYIVSTNGYKMAKPQYLVERVMGPLYQDRAGLRPTVRDTLGSYCNRISKYDGIGTFISGQVIADLKYAKQCPLYAASDWWTWASPGPGSKRGLNRLLGRLPDAPWGKQWFQELTKLKEQVSNLLPRLEIHAQDLQNCLCEFDKYERALWGQGKPKRRYAGT